MKRISFMVVFTMAMASMAGALAASGDSKSNPNATSHMRKVARAGNDGAST